MSNFWTLLQICGLNLGKKINHAAKTERGDVPGWVLVTLMTAGIVTALWAVAGPQLVQLFQDAINSVRQP
ncbi:hypothetical protein [Boudabousia liubingyangii]|uniref:hypothetical protein n=1 Tax=Boudabousia liubingyangii TaxID=1921764 RepID=UPI000A51EDAC|nr:hypothetical protein [Boudabousia liubingyangii]